MKTKNAKILIVDDNPKNIQVLANLLSENNYTIEAAMSGQEALQWVDEDSFDLILLDIMMPGMDGFEVCNTIKGKEKFKDLPIIFLTAKTDRESISRAFSTGGYDYLTKPFNREELLARVKTHVELKKSRDQQKQINRWLEEKVKERTVELTLANQKLLKLDNAKTQFLQIISHEIRTPLNGIVGGISLVEKDKLDEETASLFDMLEESVERLEKFSYKALEISQLEVRGAELMHPVGVKIKDIILSVLEELKIKSQGKKVHISQSYHTEIEKVKVDPKYFSESLFYIMDNAIKYSPDGGKVSIGVNSLAENLVIEIDDAGKGFPEGYNVQEIMPFDTLGHVDQNPGLSLYMSNQIITAHGGTIENGNRKEEGAFVRIVLPIQ